MSKARTLQDMLNDMFYAPQQAQQQQLGHGQSSAGNSSQLGNLPHWISSGTTLDPADILKILSGYTQGFTAEEKKEYDELKAQYEADVKAAKLNVFKKLPSELRQHVINSFMWKDTVAEINKTVADKGARLAELENKESLSRGYGGATLGNYSSSFNSEFKLDLQPALPEGITIEELKQAHTEACIEEELLDGEE